MDSPDLSRLTDEVLALCESPRNTANEKLNRALHAKSKDFKPLVFARPLRTYCSQKHGLSLKKSLEDPAHFLETTREKDQGVRDVVSGENKEIRLKRHGLGGVAAHLVSVHVNSGMDVGKLDNTQRATEG